MSEMASGVLASTRKGGGVLRDPKRSFRADPTDPVVPRPLMQKYGLVSGARIEGPLAKGGGRGPALADVTSICGLTPEQFKKREAFEDLVPITPVDRFDLGALGDLSMRAVDLLAPLGKGSRGLIAAPPKTGKTELIRGMARAIHAGDPDTRVIVLLIDERPEEVTMFRRGVEAEVLASSNDHGPKDHLNLTELTLDHIKVELECGNDVVVLVDSITRMGRAFNLGARGGRTMSGGVDSEALVVPRKFFGLARNIENGGSVSIIATALIDTGSRMDEVIFQEFKGTGNSEIMLDRSLSEKRIFPAIDISGSGTRRDEALLGDDDAARMGMVRRTLSERRPAEAMEAFLVALAKHDDNRSFLDSVPMGPGR